MISPESSRRSGFWASCLLKKLDERLSLPGYEDDVVLSVLAHLLDFLSLSGAAAALALTPFIIFFASRQPGRLKVIPLSVIRRAKLARHEFRKGRWILSFNELWIVCLSLLFFFFFYSSLFSSSLFIACTFEPPSRLRSITLVFFFTQVFHSECI